MRKFLVCLLAFSSSLVFAGAPEKPTPQMESLANAERAFAKMAGEHGIREAFLANFADEGVNFNPKPYNTKEAFQKRPPSQKPFPVTLAWGPIWGDVAESGDFGYSTGPTLVTDNTPQNRPPQFGFYFSVWKKQADGTWKVTVDAGIGCPDHGYKIDALDFHQAPQFKPKKKHAVEKNAMVEIERTFASATVKNNLSKTYSDFLFDTARLHRNDLLPFVGKTAVVGHYAAKDAVLETAPIRTDVSASGDLGYAYGSYDMKNRQSLASLEKGYFIRIWKRAPKGDWKLAMEIILPEPVKKD